MEKKSQKTASDQYFLSYGKKKLQREGVKLPPSRPLAGIGLIEELFKETVKKLYNGILNVHIAHLKSILEISNNYFCVKI